MGGYFRYADGRKEVIMSERRVVRACVFLRCDVTLFPVITDAHVCVSVCVCVCPVSSVVWN